MAQVNEKGQLDKPLKDSTKVRGKDVVTVYSTSSDPHHKDGEPMEVHPMLAEKLIDSGKATKYAPKEKGGK